MNTAAMTATDHRSYRLSSIDMLRGLVIVLMALDHVRDFFMTGATQDPVNDPTVSVPLYFTRWITHFCAPVFVFLAGTSAGLMVARKSPAELAKFLITRGLWLVLIEMLVISTAISFSPFGDPNFNGKTFLLLQVIWAIGVSMIVLGLLQYLGRRICLLLGLGLVLGHNALDGVWPGAQDYPQFAAPLWIGLHSFFAQPVGPFFVINAYPVLPWLGIMLLGFGSSVLFERPAEQRRRGLIRWGLLLTAAFVVLRALDVYGDPNHWESQSGGPVRTLLDFLNTTKYPPSLLFTLMTLGPAAVFCAVADRVPEVLRKPLVTVGRVPFAFYVAHIYLIHLLAVAVGVAQGFEPRQMAVLVAFLPAGYGVSLPLVYVVWVGVLVTLYPLCRWVADIKARRRDWWLSYL
jgi:uncharacterized membrane protein